MNRDIIVFDFETGGRNPLRCQPTQIAAIALDGRNFRLKGEFNSMMRPILDDDKALKAGVDPVEEGALKVRELGTPIPTSPEAMAQFKKTVLEKSLYHNNIIYSMCYNYICKNSFSYFWQSINYHIFYRCNIS